MMKRKIKHLEKDKNTEQTVVWLTQTIDTELARGEDADEQLILECAEYLQELSPEAASLTAATEKHLQAELKTATSPAARRRVTRTPFKAILRLAAVLTVLAMFCAALPAMAIYMSNEGNFEDKANLLPNPVLEFLSSPVKQDPVDYADTVNFTKEPGYSATYTDTAEMIKTELPPDILCPNDLTEDLDQYQVQVSYDGLGTTQSSVNVWEVRWKAGNGSWLFSAAYRKQFKPLNNAYYELLYDSYESNGRTYYHWVQSDGQYRAFCMYDRVIYNVLAADYETMIFLIDHSTRASEIIPSASDEETIPSADVDEIIPLLAPDQYDHPDRYSASYGTTADFIEFENVNILAVDDAAEGLGKFRIEVRHKAPSESIFSEWVVAWQDVGKRWSFHANYLPENQEFRRAEYEAIPLYAEQYVVNGRTFYITKVPLEPIAQPCDESTEYLVNYFEGNIIYSINVTGREMIDPLLNSLVMAQELAAK